MNRLTLAILAAVSSFSSFAMEKPYVGIDYQQASFDAQGVSAEPTLVRLRGGTEINPYLGVEAHVGFGAGDDTLVSSGVTYKAKINSYYGLYLRPQISLGEHASIYALVGATYMDTEFVSNTAGFPTIDGFDTNGSYGAGVDVAIYKGIRVGADFISYSSQVDAVSVGVRIPLN
ncbi:MAG TPA: porin family protein [Fluviicoccus sp.]|nr:porin family protein [Fluviicoccus sp.]